MSRQGGTWSQLQPLQRHLMNMTLTLRHTPTALITLDIDIARRVDVNADRYNMDQRG
jgi:hypothetical protein